MHRNNKGELMLFSRRTAIMGAIAGGLALYNDTSRAAIVNALRSDPEKDKNKVPHLPASILPEAVPLSGNVLNLNDRWQVNTDYAAVVDRLSMSNPKKDFVKFAIAGVIDVLSNQDSINKLNNGVPYTINPRVMLAQAVLETYYGTDATAALGNYFGIQSSGKNTVPVATHEDLGKGKEPKIGSFRVYNPAFPFDSFHDYARLISTKSYFADAAVCRYDDKKYLLGLENVINADGDVIGKQGGEYQGNKVMSYATDRGYVASVMNVIDFLNLDQVFTVDPTRT